MAYNEKVVDHFNNPRNMRSFKKDGPSVGTGIAGALECGDVKLAMAPMSCEIVETSICRGRAIMPRCLKAIPKPLKMRMRSSSACRLSSNCGPVQGWHCKDN